MSSSFAMLLIWPSTISLLIWSSTIPLLIWPSTISLLIWPLTIPLLIWPLTISLLIWPSAIYASNLAFDNIASNLASYISTNILQLQVSILQQSLGKYILAAEKLVLQVFFCNWVLKGQTCESDQVALKVCFFLLATRLN